MQLLNYFWSNLSVFDCFVVILVQFISVQKIKIGKDWRTPVEKHRSRLAKQTNQNEKWFITFFCSSCNADAISALSRLKTPSSDRSFETCSSSA